MYELLQQAKEKNKDALLEIIIKFQPKIKKCLHQTTSQDREDLEQELVTKIIEVIHSFDHILTK